MTRSSLLLALGASSLLLAAPAPALAKSCGSVKGVGGGTKVTDVRATTGSCPSAKSVAKTWARAKRKTPPGNDPTGYRCTFRNGGSADPRRTSYRVTCRTEGRAVTFKVAFDGLVFLQEPALPQANAG